MNTTVFLIQKDTILLKTEDKEQLLYIVILIP